MATSNRHVWVRTGRYKSGGTDTVYHTNSDCGYLTESHVKKSMDVVDRTEWRECSACKNGHDGGVADQKSALRYQV